MMETEVVAAQLEADGRECEYRLIVRDAEALYGIQRFSAADTKDHVCLVIDRQRPERLHSLVGTVLPEQFFSDDREVRLITAALILS